MSRSSRLGVPMVVVLLTAAALLLGIALHPLAVDDAFITYRYAYNLANGLGFTYNPGRPVLSTTAPLYALLLAAGARVWPGASVASLPSLANTLSAVALWAAALLLFTLGQREKMPWAGALAALLLILQPLLWLSLGLETALFLALALGAILAYRSEHLYWTAALLALATLTRGDGLILTAVLAADSVLGWLCRRRQAAPPGENPKIPRGFRRLVGAGVVYVAVTLPVALWLTWQFGSPLPATLRAKVAQSALGITGFYAHTTYLQGLVILIRARLAQSPLYLLFLPAIAAGLVALRRQAVWVRLLLAWGAAHLVSYTLLGVTPYYWYYAPLVPALVSVTALGLVDVVRWLERRKIGKRGNWGLIRWGLGGLWVLALVGALAGSDWAMVRALDGPVPPPEQAVSKVLPEAKAGVYRQVGQWLHDHTPDGATVGVTEVGVMGYYSGRTMVDFLGLLEPDVAQALARGDLTWGLLRYQPDFLALTAVSPLYAYDLRADPWFQAAYAPIQTFADPRFWGSPVTVYQRRVPRFPLISSAGGGLPAGAVRLDVEFGGQIRLLAAIAGPVSARPGELLPLTLYWQALGPVPHDYTVFVHLLGQYDRVLAQRDAAPGLGAHPTSRWAPGETVVDPYLLALPQAAYAPDQAVWEVGLYDARTGRRLQTADGRDNVRFGEVAIAPRSDPLALNFGPVVLTGYELDRLALSPGQALHLALRWQAPLGAARPVQVTVQLVGETGTVGAQGSRLLASAPDAGDLYELTVGAAAPQGVYDLEVLVADPASGQLLPLLGPDGQPRGDRARLTKVRLYP